MASKINDASVENDSVEGNLRAIRSDKIITTEMVDSNGKVKCMVHQSSSQYGGTIIAIDHVFILERVKIPEIKKRELSTIYCRNGDDSNGRETDAWSKNPQRKKSHQPQYI